MCGICGILNYTPSAHPIDEILLKRMSDEIAHRGPDDEGSFLSRRRNAGFGFRRLAIVDLSPAGHQPMSTSDGDVTLIFNGEIYNHLVLRKELEARGYRYRSRADSETILYAYREYGPEFVHRLLGMFAIAIWDERTQQLLLARDRIGIKPIYYTQAGGSFVFGSEIKALLNHPRVPRAMNEAMMPHYLTFLATPPPETLFHGVRKLEAGHMLTVKADGAMQDVCYWDLSNGADQPSINLDGTPAASSPFLAPDLVQSEDACVETIRTLLRQSIKDRMMSDVPFGVLLSGGIDSSTNVALMAELMDRPVQTFSVGFKDLEKYNELEYARSIAGRFRTDHHEIIIGQKDAFDFLPSLIHHQDEPIGDPVCLPLYFVSKLARDSGTIVVQVGEGSDEEFIGYPYFVRLWNLYNTWWKRYGWLPGFVRKGVHAAAATVLAPRQQYLALEFLRKAAYDEELFWGGATYFTETHKRYLLAHGSSGQSSGTYAAPWHRQLLNRRPHSDYLQRMMYVEFRHRLPELLLMRVDKMSMATSIEARVPFLDHRFVEYTLNIPSGLKLAGGTTKHLLKKAVRGIIPDAIIDRKKQGFAAPINEWMRQEWRPFIERTLLESTLVQRGYFNKPYLTSLFNAHMAGKVNAAQDIWTLVNLNLWYDQWIERKETV